MAVPTPKIPPTCHRLLLTPHTSCAPLIAPPFQAAVVLAFMFSASWRLTVVTFVLVPMVLLISKVSVCTHVSQPLAPLL